ELNENKEKRQKTWLSKYNVDNPVKSKEIYNKIKNTNKLKYGVEYISQSNIIKEKIKQTCLKKYGTEYYLNSDDCKQMTIEKFGTDNYRKTDKCKNKVSEYIKKHNKEIQEKMNITKLKNNSFNKSKDEDESYLLLKNIFNNVLRQYKSIKYPYNCDFYIPKIDLYIECNYHWTHGGHAYEGNENDLNLINIWKQKNTKYYDKAIICWSKRDVKKRNIAKENNLNWIEFWNIDELKTFLLQFKKEVNN
ncbi:hypothetical protein IKN40_06120, partial [bacterium]|nr:hypothetical protein [bacterium]